jgi:hypothetical protein
MPSRVVTSIGIFAHHIRYITDGRAYAGHLHGPETRIYFHVMRHRVNETHSQLKVLES